MVFPSSVKSSRELGRALEAITKTDSFKWGSSLLQMVALLHEPVYISHYLRGLASAASLNGLPVGQLIDVVMLTATHPWAPPTWAIRPSTTTRTGVAPSPLPSTSQVSSPEKTLGSQAARTRSGLSWVPGTGALSLHGAAGLASKRGDQWHASLFTR
jgi:hypothetical protein